MRSAPAIGLLLVIALATAGCTSSPTGSSSPSAPPAVGSSASALQPASSPARSSTPSASPPPIASPPPAASTAPEKSTAPAMSSAPAQSPAPAATAAMTLAEPTGPAPVGTSRLHLRDTGRTDPLLPSAGPREVVAQLWYPAATKGEGQPAPYAPAAEAAALAQFYPVPPGAFAGRTHSAPGAAVAAGRHQVIVFTHGLCGSLTDSTNVAEQLASEGYVVVAVSAVHEDPAVELPNGRVLTTSDQKFCQVGADPFSTKGQALLNKLLAARVGDIKFTVDQLENIGLGRHPVVDGAPPPAGLAAAMTLTKMGIYGHSFGGGTAAAVLHTDRRFAAGINLDGFVIGPVATTGLSKPFLVVGVPSHDRKLDPSWKTFLPALKGWRRWLVVNGAGHYRFMDLGGSPTKWGLDTTLKPKDPTTWEQVFGDIDDATSQRIVRDLVTGFFGQFLRQNPAAILVDPAKVYPELIDRTSEIGR